METVVTFYGLRKKDGTVVEQTLPVKSGAGDLKEQCLKLIQGSFNVYGMAFPDSDNPDRVCGIPACEFEYFWAEVPTIVLATNQEIVRP